MAARQWTDLTMRKMLVIAACGFALTACTSSSDLLKTATPTIPMQFESEPAGAQVKTPDGQSCKTPCALAVPAADFMATFTLAGHQTQEISVRLVPPEDPRLTGGVLVSGPRFDPNPVSVELERDTRRPARPARKPAASAQPGQAQPSPAAKPSAAKPSSAKPSAAKPAAAAPAAAPAAPASAATPWPTPSQMPDGGAPASAPWPGSGGTTQ